MLLEMALRYFNLTNYWSVASIDLPKFLLNTIVSTIPFALIWLFIGMKKENRQAALYALLTFVGLTILIAFYSSLLSENKDWLYLLYIIKFIVTAGVYGYFRFEAKGLGFALVGLAMVGIIYSFQPYFYFDKLEDLFRLLGFRFDISSVYEQFGLFNIISNIFNLVSYVLMYYVISYFTFWFDKIKLQDWRLSKMVFVPAMRNDLTFSILFWSFRIFIITIALSGARNFYSWNQDFIDLRVLLIVLLSAAGIYVVISLYRNFLTLDAVSRGKAPSWQMLGLNIPLVNFVVWLVKLSSVHKHDINTTLDGETNQIVVNSKSLVETARSHFINTNKNQGIKTFAIILYCVILIINFLTLVSYANGEDALIYFLITAAVTISVLVWYLSDYRAAHVLIIVSVVLVLILQFFFDQQIRELYGLGAMVNLTLYYAIFHFNEMKFVGIKEEKQDLLQQENDDILDIE